MTEKSLIEVPADGARIQPGQPTPANPIIPFIEGDGIGVDITPVMKDVVDAAVTRAYDGARELHWMEIYAGEKSTRVYGADEWLPQETLDIVREYSVETAARTNAKSLWTYVRCSTRVTTELKNVSASSGRLWSTRRPM